MKISLQPAVLEWARQRAGLSGEELAKKLTAKPEQVKKWENDGNLTYKRAEKLAKVTHTPFGYLFLSVPPEEKLPVADFRTVGSEGAGDPARSFSMSCMMRCGSRIGIGNIWSSSVRIRSRL